MKEVKKKMKWPLLIIISIAVIICGWYFFKSRMTIREYTWKSPDLYYFESLQKHTPEEARQMTLKWLRQNPLIKEAILSNDDTKIWVKYKDGHESFVEICQKSPYYYLKWKYNR